MVHIVRRGISARYIIHFQGMRMWVEANLAMKVTPRHFVYNIEIKEVLNICLIISFAQATKLM